MNNLINCSYCNFIVSYLTFNSFNLKRLHAVDDRTVIRRLAYKAVWPTSARDFVVCTTWRELEDGSLIIATKFGDDSLAASPKGFVRGKILAGGYWIQPAPANGSAAFDGILKDCCRVTLVAHTDLGGSIPVSLVNAVATTAPVNILTKLHELAGDKK